MEVRYSLTDILYEIAKYHSILLVVLILITIFASISVLLLYKILFSPLSIKRRNFNELKKKDPNKDAMQKEATAQFKSLREKKIYWKGAEYVDFKFSKQGISKDVNFDWGSAILNFESEEAHYELKIGEFTSLIISEVRAASHSVTFMMSFKL